MNKFVCYVKNLTFIFASILLIVLWNLIFILQGAIGTDGPIYILALKVIPFFLVSTLIAFAFIKMIDRKKKLYKPFKISVFSGVFAVTLSILFQNAYIYGKLKVITLENKNFSHLEPINVVPNEFMFRLPMSLIAYLNVLPLTHMDDELTSHLNTVSLESAMIYNISQLVSKENIKNTCKEYVKNNFKNGHCFVDLQTEIFRKFQFSSTGNILFVVAGSMATSKMKKNLEGKYDKKNLFVVIKSLNDIFEMTLNSMTKLQDIVNVTPDSYKFTMGYQLKKTSYLQNVENKIAYKFLEWTMHTFNDLQKEFRNKTPEFKKYIKTENATFKDSINAEFKRMNDLTNRLTVLQKNGFDAKSIEKKSKIIDQRLELNFEDFKKRSILFKVSLFFRPELESMTIQDMFKRQKKVI